MLLSGFLCRPKCAPFSDTKDHTSELLPVCLDAFQTPGEAETHTHTRHTRTCRLKTCTELKLLLYLPLKHSHSLCHPLYSQMYAQAYCILLVWMHASRAHRISKRVHYRHDRRTVEAHSLWVSNLNCPCCQTQHISTKK